MARELGITLYLFVFRVIFNLFKQLPQKKKTVCVASFGDNIFYAVRELQKLSNEEIIILKDNSCRYDFHALHVSSISFSMKHPFAFFLSIYHLATSTTIIVDTYYGFLDVTRFRHGVRCIQLWHAAGALKQFGLQDPSIAERSERAKNRFQNVYSRFDYTVVGSDEMAATFKHSFGLTEDRIVRTGVPRTDIFFDEQEKQRILLDLKQDFQAIGDRKIILYAPTFRKEELDHFQMALDIHTMYQSLSNEYVLFIKPHPAVSYSIEENYKDFVFDVSRYADTNHLLLITDILITDYSSIPFEYALLEKPMIFFAYDLEEYKVTNGLIDDYENQMPGPVVFTTEEIVDAIQHNRFDYDKIREFSELWNAYSNGNSSKQLAAFLSDTEERSKEKVLV
ncbi:CDP-glycerol glycerophosphotransferase family protein [Virgibacillus halodenitrificans]|uniref:CDP-glycerol glycerophosphotransferase family protein n=1 Tax=Virgibacillus halodenitrificans TaxID=1482 RepID=UPI001FB2FD7C|nr:CDP-glycerol glycerophosphotransferase family protein [Virgibacillus halodenitrificans]MCJ0929616.1 CDP-glycerol glycerophosphotransferase family protein [Virgibacillus halodenitrificans]WHX26071.1 CDP-glycerol glycerophosphotransferase family protein [Virgibacillus halodenitrificans]